MSKKSKRRKRRNLLLVIMVLCIVTAAFAANVIAKERQKSPESKNITDNLQDKHAEQTDTAEKEPEKEVNSDVTIKMSATGDIIFHQSQVEEAYDSSTGKYDFTNSFREVKSILDSADIAVANFEGTTGGNEVYDYQGYPLFNAPDEALDAIKYAGFDVLSTVNNHTLDTRKAGVIRTVEQIKKAGMDSVGTYVKKPETRVLIKDVKGIKIAFMAYTEMVNGLESTISNQDLDDMINVIDETKIKEDIEYAKAQNADVVVAFMHWGNEYAREQNAKQEELADMMFKQGVDIILGSHPHVIQPSKKLDYDGETKFVVYSMGNFISNQRTETLSYYGISNPQYTEDGIIINFDIEKKGKTGEVSIKKIDYIPLWVYKGAGPDGKIEHVTYPIMQYMESDELNVNSKERMNRSYDDTMSQMDVD